MGHSHSTPKSVEDVLGDLKSKLLANASSTLHNDYGVTLEATTSLEQALKALATQRFKAKFQYDYNDDPTKCQPLGSIGGVSPMSDYCGINDPTSNETSSYISTKLFTSTGVPEWAKDTAKGDLGSLITTLIRQPSGLVWQDTYYAETFDAKVEDQASVKTDAVLLYVNAALTEDGVDATMCVVYYLGLYYQVNSKTKGLRDSLQNSAYASALKLNPDPTPISSDEQLKNALKAYGTKKFKEVFQFDYTSAPPDALVGSAGTLNRNDMLIYIPDQSTDRLKTSIEQGYFKGVDIYPDNDGTSGITTSACTDLLNQVNALAGEQSTKSWAYQQIAHTYDPLNPVLNPIKSRGLVMYYYDHATSDAEVSIAVAYIYVMAIYYETEPLKTVVTKDLFAELTNNLTRHITNYQPPVNAVPDAEFLKDILFQYTSQVFQSRYGYAYNRNATIQVPASSGKAIGFDELIDLGDYPPTSGQIQQRFELGAFTRDYVKFPKAAVGPIYDIVLTTLKLWTGTDTPKDANFWYSQNTNPMAPMNTTQTFQGQLMFVYALGQKAEQNVSVQRLFVYFIGVFSAFTTNPDGGW